MRTLKLTGLLLCATLTLASCFVPYRPRQFSTGAWLTHATQEECMKSEAVIGDTDARRPYYFSISRSYYSYWTPWGNWDCAQQWGRPRGYVAARFETFKWYPNSGWAMCSATNGWQYNTENNIYEVWSGALEPVAHYTPPCGAGYYVVRGWTAIRNNGWHYGYVDTDYMGFPGQI